MDKSGRFTGRKAIEVPDTAETGRTHTPERIGPAPGMLVRSADLYAPDDNGGVVYVGWSGTSSIPGMETPIELRATDVATIQCPFNDEDGKPCQFDLHDLYISGRTNADAVMYFTW